MNKENKLKIEFFVSKQDKELFLNLCNKHSYKMAELMRRAFEEKLEWLKNK